MKRNKRATQEKIDNGGTSISSTKPVRSTKVEQLRTFEVKPGRVQKKGRGLTQRAFHSVSLSDLMELHDSNVDARPFIQELLVEATIWQQLTQIKKNAQGLLQKKRLPDSDAVVEDFGNGKWKPFEAEPIRKRRRPTRSQKKQRTVLGLELALKREESPEWFAAQQLRLLTAIGEASRYVVSLFASGIELGALVEREQWKRKHEPAAVRAYTRSKVLTKHGLTGAVENKIRAKARYEATVRGAKKLLEKNPNLKRNKPKLAQLIRAEEIPELLLSEGRGYASVSTIRRYLTTAVRRSDLR